MERALKEPCHRKTMTFLQCEIETNRKVLMPMDVSLVNLLDHCFKRELKECLNAEIWEIFACGIQFWENLACGIRNTAQGMWNPTITAFIIQVPLTKTGIQFLNYGSTAWNPESKTVFDWIF